MDDVTALRDALLGWVRGPWKESFAKDVDALIAAARLAGWEAGHDCECWDHRRRPEEPRVERCAECGVGRWVTAHDPEAGPSHHPFTPEAR